MTAVPTQRILVFIHSLHGGGAERVAADLTHHWALAGHAVRVVTQADAQGDVYTLHPAVERRVLNTASDSGGGLAGIWANVRRVCALRAQIKAFRPDIVLGMMTSASILAVLAARNLRCAVIATEHTHPPSQALSPMWLRLRRYTYPRAARVVALTQGTADWLAEHVPGSRLAVIPNPVHWPLPDGEPRLMPPQSPGRQVLLAVGRMHRDKGFDILIEAFARIASQQPQWDLVILGEGTPAQRTALQTQIEAAGLGKRVHLPGRAGNVGAWYAAAECYVLSSRFEGLSNTLLEAMAAGLPVVSMDCDTGPREVVRDGVDGILVRPNGDAQALARTLTEVMSDGALRARLAAHAPEVRDRFGAGRVLGLWQDEFDAVKRERSLCAE